MKQETQKLDHVFQAPLEDFEESDCPMSVRITSDHQLTNNLKKNQKSWKKDELATEVPGEKTTTSTELPKGEIETSREQEKKQVEL